MDLRLFHDPPGQSWDLALEDADLATEAGLEAAVAVSLFSDRLAGAEDELPHGGTDRRGWWADPFNEADGDLIGSRLWLLRRSKLTPATLQAARAYAEEALAWLKADGIAGELTVETEAVGRDVLGLRVVIKRPDVAPAEFRFETLWSAL